MGANWLLCAGGARRGVQDLPTISCLAGLRLGCQNKLRWMILTANWGLIKTPFGFQHVVHIKKVREVKINVSFAFQDTVANLPKPS